MNSQFVLAFLISVFAVIAAVPTSPQCGPNAEYHACGTACPATCKDPNRPNRPCTRQCVEGCFCNEGYLKHDNGQCVHESKCSESTMPETKPMPDPSIPEPFAPEHIFAPGPVLMEPMPETKPYPMPQFCGENEEYFNGKPCDATCDQPNPICHKICEPGCSCMPGHVRDANGKCIPEANCGNKPKLPLPLLIKPEEPQCPQNEIFRSCGSACPPTCEDPHPSPLCSHDCVVGCFCVEGYLRDAQGKCIPEKDCEPTKFIQAAVNRIPLRVPEPREHKCPSDREVYSECGSQKDCIASCGNPPLYLIRGVPQIPEKCKKMECTPSCACQFPYYRNAQGQCVEKKECN